MMGNFGSDYDYYGMGGFGFGFMWIFGFIFWISVIVGIIIAIKWLLGHGDKKWQCFGGGALEILKERYAKGEITKQQYEEMKKEIGS